MSDNTAARLIRETIRDDHDLHREYLTNAQFHYAVDTACQAPTTRAAVVALLTAVSTISREHERLAADVTMARMTGSTS